jgi:hypothetical protein
LATTIRRNVMSGPIFTSLICGDAQPARARVLAAAMAESDFLSADMVVILIDWFRMHSI